MSAVGTPESQDRIAWQREPQTKQSRAPFLVALSAARDAYLFGSTLEIQPNFGMDGMKT